MDHLLDEGLREKTVVFHRASSELSEDDLPAFLAANTQRKAGLRWRSQAP